MNHKNISNCFTWILIILLVYMLWCFIDYQLPPSYYKPVSYHVIHLDNTQSPTMEIDPKNPIEVKRGEDLVIKFWVSRHRSGHLDIRRLIEVKDRNVYNSGSWQRTVIANKAMSLAYYSIPSFIKVGCNNYIYSRVEYQLKGNVITYILPIIKYTPKIQFCVK